MPLALGRNSANVVLLVGSVVSQQCPHCSSHLVRKGYGNNVVRSAQLQFCKP